MCFEQDNCSCIVPIHQTSSEVSCRPRRISVAFLEPQFLDSEDTLIIEELESDDESCSDGEVMIGEIEEPITRRSSVYIKLSELDEEQRNILASINELSSGDIPYSKLESGVKRSRSDLDSFTSAVEEKLRKLSCGTKPNRRSVRFMDERQSENMDMSS